MKIWHQTNSMEKDPCSRPQLGWDRGLDYVDDDDDKCQWHHSAETIHH